MGKLTNFLVSGLMVVAGAVIATIPGGQAIGVSLVSAGIASFAAATLNLLFGPKAPKPQSIETQIKNPTPPRVYGYGTRRIHGAVSFWGNTSGGATVDVVAFADGKAHAVRQAYLNDDPVTVTGGVVQQVGTKYKGGKVLAGWNLGQTPAPVHSAVVAQLPGIWTTAHRGDGVVSGYLIKNPVKDDEYLDTYPQGDNVILSLVIDLQLCFDPREAGHDIDDASTWEWTENPVLQLLHYFVVRRGYSYDTKILPQIAFWIAAANVCDEVISGEARYRSWVLYDSTAKPAEVIGSLLETFDGWYAENERGEIVIYAGEYYEPTVTIGPDQIVEYEYQGFVEEENIVNELSVKYISDAHDYNEVEAQPWRDETDIAARGSVNSQGIAPQTPSFKQNRRLAKITMARNNTPDRGTVVTNYSGRIAEGQRFINLLIKEAGTVIFDGVAEIQHITRNLETHGLTIEWSRAEAFAWSWSTATEDGYGAPTGTFPTIAPPDPPTLDSTAYVIDAGTASLTIEGTGPDRDDLTWYARFRETSTSSWSEQRYDDVEAGAWVTLTIPFIPLDISLDVEISYDTGNGKFSGWSNTAIVTADTSDAAPTANTSFSATGGTGEVTGSWSNSTSVNFGHSELWSGPDSDIGNASQLGTDYAAGAGVQENFTETLAAGTYYLWTLAYNDNDTAASTTGPIQVTVT